jgi:hypothetical protein
MEIELVPELDPDDLAFLAAEAAIERTGLADDVRPAGNTSAWWRAGVHEAVERGISSREHEAAAGRGDRQGSAPGIVAGRSRIRLGAVSPQ